MGQSLGFLFKIFLERVFVPPLHVLVQGDQSLQVLTLQELSQQFWTLQACMSLVSGQASPPFSADRVIALLLTWTPPPHPLEHRLHCDHSPTWQSTFQGQGFVLQSVDCMVAGHRILGLRAPTNARVRVLVPPPQGSEHLDHMDQSPTLQWHAAPGISQILVSDELPEQFFPGVRMLRTLFCWPMHCLLQEDHSDQLDQVQTGDSAHLIVLQV
mmetsp:Transcript_53371/g.73975  ORF Transcript_53371/g.73975 Transcript_53371/m.73975 type:complete len:213 (+) Transcript_53371:171-809(+)